MATKRCKTCCGELPAAEFYRSPNTPDGLDYECKACKRARSSRNRDAKIDYYRAFDRQRADLPHRVEGRALYASTKRGKESQRAAKAAWAMRNKDRRAAHSILDNEIRRGRMMRQPCEVCGVARSHAHHDDYAQPLKVRWLCAGHHALLHKTERD